MNEFDQDALLNDAFAQFSAAAAPALRPLGTQAVRREVAFRRKVRASALSVAAVLVVAVPVAAYAAFGRNPAAPVATTSPSPSASRAPSPSASPSPSPSPSVSPAPDGRISVGQLTAGEVTLLEWGPLGSNDGGTCPQGQVRLGAEAEAMFKPYLASVTYANMDADSALETVAMVKCQVAQPDIEQVLVFDRTAQGKIVTLGQLYHGYAWKVTANPAGGVDVEVSDAEACCAQRKEIELHQIRTYGWNGSKLTQLAGPRAFSSHDKQIDLKINLKSATWSEPKDGFRTSVIVVTVTNLGPADSDEFIVYDTDNPLAPLVRHAGVKAGQSAQVSITIKRNASTPADLGSVELHEMGSWGVGGDADITNDSVPVPAWN